MDKRQMYGYLDEIQTELFDLSDHIWDYAETAFEEHKSAAELISSLAHNGFKVESGLADIETAFCATWGEGAPVVGILAEYDALSSLSQAAGTAVKKERESGGNGHGCGHNVFGAASVGAALALKKYLEANGRRGTVKLFGCPGEEGGSGKAFMARGKVFDGVDVAFAWHPMEVNAIMDFASLANYQILYKFTGIASHAAAAPHKGRSALDAVELMNVGVNFLREHVIQEARIHYAITDAGGFSPNVVQPHANVLYLIRAPKTPQVEEIYQRINKIAEGAALMTETEVEIQFIKACANIVRNTTLSWAMYENFKELQLPVYTKEEQAFAREIRSTLASPVFNLKAYFSNLPDEQFREYSGLLADKDLCDILLPYDKNYPDNPLPGSSDVGDVSWNVPTAQICTACYALATTPHSWQLVSQARTSLAHKGLLMAAKVIAASAVDCVENPELIKAAKDELSKRLQDEVYKCAIPDDVMPKAISAL